MSDQGNPRRLGVSSVGQPPRAEAEGGASTRGATPSQGAAWQSGPSAARLRGAILRRLLALADWVAVVIGLAAAFNSGLSVDPSGMFWGLLLSPIWILAFKVIGLYDRDHRRVSHSTFDELPDLLTAAVFGTLIMIGLLTLTPAPYVHGRDVAQMGFAAFIISSTGRSGARALWRSVTRGTTSLLIGSGPSAASLARRLNLHPEARVQLVGYLGHTADEAAVDDESAAEGLKRLGNVFDLRRVAVEHGVERILIADDNVPAGELQRVIADCKRGGMGLTIVPPNANLLGPGVELNRLAELPLLDFRFSDPPRSTLFLKRAMDIAVSGIVLICSSPLILLTAIAVKLDSRGPVFFTQVRIGQGGERFRMLKFRSMVADAEDRLKKMVDFADLDEPAFKLRDDPRITRFGRFIRRTSIDEIPQFFNVLMGDMSLVGPRPEQEAIVDLYNERQRVRLQVKPGLTGPMQVYGRGDLSFEERLALERDYLDNLTITGDIAILLRTPRAVIRGGGAY